MARPHFDAEPAPELQALAGPLLDAAAVRRLRNVTFLGVLSAKFRHLAPEPVRGLSTADGANRLAHSIGVADLALVLADSLDLSDRGRRYVAAWGLTHDIATWPLSHTGEPGFSAAIGVGSREIRRRMILGEPTIAPRHRVDAALRTMVVDPATLAALFGSRPLDATDEELAAFQQIVHCPLTPDTLEGVARSRGEDRATARSEGILRGFFRRHREATTSTPPGSAW